MQLNSKKAMDDFDIIKFTFEQTKNDYKGFRKILFQYGILQSTIFLIKYMASLIEPPSLMIYALLFFLSMICDLIFLVLFLRMYNLEKGSSNKYYLSCMGVWGLFAVTLPFMDILMRISLILFTNEKRSLIALKLQGSMMLVNMFLFCMSLLICSFIFQRKLLSVLALMIFFVFFELHTLFFDTAVSDFGFQIYFIIHNVLTTVGYICVSFLFIWRDKHGHK